MQEQILAVQRMQNYIADHIELQLPLQIYKMYRIFCHGIHITYLKNILISLRRIISDD